MNPIGWADRRIGGCSLALSLLLSAYPSNRLSAQCPDGSPPPCRAAPTDPGRKPGASPNSVAVLYFDNLSRDTADAYLADGLTEAISIRLGQVERLLVKSPNAVRRYRGRAAADPTAVGRALGVGHLVSGSVRRSGNRLRVTITLTRAASGIQLWGEQFDRSNADLLAIEEEIARAVATTIAGRLLPTEQAAVGARATPDPAAYDHYVKGNYYLARRTANAGARALQDYDAAIRLDPAFSAAFARVGLAYALSLQWGWQPAVSAETLLARGFAATERALRLDSRSADAWVAQGYLLTFRDPLTYAGVAEAFRRAVALDPHNAEALHQLAGVLLNLGDDSGSEAASRRALALDPDRPITLWDLALLHLFRREYRRSATLIDSALAIDPAFAPGYVLRAHLRALSGDGVGARADAETALRLDETARVAIEVVLGLVEVRAGDRVPATARAERVLQETEGHDPPSSADQAATFAMLLVALGDWDRALDVLERVTPRGLHFWVWLRWPWFDPLRSHPRFRRLAEESKPR